MDPFCGSGTIAIEAALLAYQISHLASPENLPLWIGLIMISNIMASTLSAPPDKPSVNLLPDKHNDLKIFASDRDAGAIRICSIQC